MWQKVTATILLIASIAFLNYGIQQSDFWQFLPAWLLSFGAYYWIIRQQNYDVKLGVSLAVGLRILLLFSFPNLSDDIYRFVWDGRLLLNEIHPFAQLPSELITSSTLPEGITKELYEQLNSPDYYTIYPPVAQAVFWFSNWCSPDSIAGTALVMKIILCCFEIGTIVVMLHLLKHLKLPNKTIFLYALNPLILIEIVGNLHFEGVMIFFLLLAIYALVQAKGQFLFILSALCFALSIASKLLPLLFLPLFISYLGWRKSIQYFIWIGVFLIACFAPLVSGLFVDNFGDSLNLYFQKFEFNASLYYVFRWLGYQWKGYNMISSLGPMMAICTFISILLLSYFRREQSKKVLIENMLFAITIYLLFATTVHPWYSSLPLAIGVFTRFHYPVVWTFLIGFTYINYSYEVYQENLWIVAFEYIILSTIIILEIFLRKNFQQV